MIPPRLSYSLRLLFVCACLLPGASMSAAPLTPDVPVRGWTILSRSEPDALITLTAAPAYAINHLQLSHHLVHDLKEIKDDSRCALVNRLIDAAHAGGITEVVLWDHAFYELDYYPKEFRTGPNGTLDLDNPAFWEWVKADYRKMLDRVPNADGIVLTFIETGARAERQHSQRLKTNQQKLAAVVDAVADVVIGERKLNLYARTFAYTHEEYANIIGAVGLFTRKDIRLMMKETPHDFFLTHPNDRYAGTIPRPTLIEFDAAGEFNGQGIVANTWPEYMLRRWRDFSRRSHIIGYTARADRYGDTRLVGRPGEINLFALKRGVEDPHITSEQVYDEFITARYGATALPAVKAAFRQALKIAECVFYTLGTNIANHSALNYDPYASSYGLHVSGKWFDPPIVEVSHGVGREFHYWRDLLDHLAPAFVKAPGNRQWDEIRFVRDRGWVRPGEHMSEEYLRYIVTEKNHGVTLAEEAVRHIESARASLKAADYEELHHYFTRTLLTARLHRATASAYFGFRVWCRGDGYRSDFVRETVQSALAEMRLVAKLIRDYPAQPPIGQWNWRKDADQAEQYFKWIVTDGWPAQTRGVANPQGGLKFPFSEAVTEQKH
jgi:hypothetical protein